MVKEIQVKFTDEKVTAWRGMKLMKDTGATHLN